MAEEPKVWNVTKAGRYSQGYLVEEIDREGESDFLPMVSHEDYLAILGKLATVEKAYKANLALLEERRETHLKIQDALGLDAGMAANRFFEMKSRLSSSKKSLDAYRSISDEMIYERDLLVREIIAWFDVAQKNYDLYDGTVHDDWPLDWLRRARDMTETIYNPKPATATVSVVERQETKS